LLDMKGVDNETVGFKFSVEPFEGGLVGGHGDLTKHVLTSSGKIGGIKDNLVIFEAELKVLSVCSTFFFGLFKPVNIVHAVVHAVLGATFPHGVVIFSPELVSKRLVSLVLEETISS
jgi:hypothetical protein